MSGVLRWEDPPPIDTRQRGQDWIPWSLIAEQLRQRPGQWAVACEGSRDASAAARIKKGTMRWFRPAGAFEAVHRIMPHGRVALYARYVGEPS